MSGAREQKKTPHSMTEKALRFAFWIRDLHRVPSATDVCERFAVSRPTAYRWLAVARAVRGVYLP